jgi:CRISPR-associated protein Cmr2
MKMKTVHVSIGPVQSYISQARRTRDLLAGSFILSYLSGCAMVRVLEEKGKIIKPQVDDDPLLYWIRNRSGEEGPWIGSLPNTFTAEIPDETHPSVVEEAVDHAWKRIAQAVYNKVFDKCWSEEMLEEARKIWQRQVENFWEVTWVIGEDSKGLHHRKYWRIFFPQEEPGDKCSITGNLQELSGKIRIHERSDQDKFWEKVRNKIGALNLGKSERLSAIALIKRVFPTVTKEALGWKFPDDAVRFPSTASLAAIPWLKEVGEKRKDAAKAFLETAEQAGIGFMENPGGDWDGDLKAFYKLEGSVFFESNLKRKGFWEEDGRECKHKEALIEKWEELTGKKKKDESAHNEKKEKLLPSPYYALLSMDGDSLGKLLDQTPNKGRISQALANFTRRVADIVRCKGGYPIYAGGDDVLALLPLPKALPAVAALRRAYREAFQEQGICKATISAGLVYAHYKAPLQKIIQHAHHLLNDIAKEQGIRDSLAVGVWKGSGPVWTWVAPWECVFAEEEKQSHLERVRDEIKRGMFSSSFFYNVQERLRSLVPFGKDKSSMKQYRETVRKWLFAEYIRINPSMDREKAMAQVKGLLALCLRSRRDHEGDVDCKQGAFSINGALIARFLFLAEEGREMD